MKLQALRDNELNVALLLTNVTFDPMIMKTITARKANASLFQNIF